MKWKILYSIGPVDNPDNGELEVEANDMAEAIAKAEMEGLRLPDFDAIIISDIWEDLNYSIQK